MRALQNAIGSALPSPRHATSLQLGAAASLTSRQLEQAAQAMELNAESAIASGEEPFVVIISIHSWKIGNWNRFCVIGSTNNW